MRSVTSVRRTRGTENVADGAGASPFRPEVEKKNK